MIIPINDKYRISSDTNCWRIDVINKKKGIKEWVVKYYYTDVESAVKALGEKMIRESKADNIVDAIRECKKINETIAKATGREIC